MAFAPLMRGQVQIKCLQELTLSLARGGEAAYFCVGDGLIDTVKFKPNTFATPIAFLVTDERNVIVEVSLKPVIDFEPYGPRRLRVWALSFVGDLLAQPGMDAAVDKLATVCHELSLNFIPIYNIIPEGGMVATSTGRTVVFTCPGDGVADLVDFATTSADPLYAYVVTDEDNRILAAVDGAAHDFESAPQGVCRVWGFSYVGNLIFNTGDDVTAVALADGCFDLSNNFVTVIKVVPDGGRVRLAGGGNTAAVCTGDDAPDVLVFETNTASPAPYVFLLTDTRNRLLQVIEGDRLDFNPFPAGVCRVRGLSFTGELTIQPGDVVTEVPASDGCFDLSANFIRVEKKDPEGGRISLGDGAVTARICVSDGAPDILDFVVDAELNYNYVFLITDENNIILDISERSAIDFEGRAGGVVRVWGLAYSGNLSAQVGDDATSALLSDECFELSENFVSLTLIALEAGKVSLEDGAADDLVCQGVSGAPSARAFIADGAAGGSLTFLLTDDNNIILEVSAGGVFDFADAASGSYRVWSLVYSGELLAAPGLNAAEIELSDECFDLSDNFARVVVKLVDGGAVRLESGEENPRLCANDGQPDLLRFLADTESEASYVFLLTDENNVIQQISADGEIDFEGGPAGPVRVWGLSFTGALTAQVGDEAGAAALSDECFALSANFIVVTRVALQGGQVFGVDGQEDKLVCQGTGATTVRNFQSAGAQGGDFTFLVADENNVILAVSSDPAIDFGAFAPGVVRVWGLAYTGALLAEAGQNAASAILSDECFALSDNFVTVTIQFVDGGMVRLENGEDAARICVNDGQPDILTFATSSTSAENYIFIITDENNIIERFSESSVIDFEGDRGGIARVWGLSYTGELKGNPGDNIGDLVFTHDCFELSVDFVAVNRIALMPGEIRQLEGDTGTACIVPGRIREDIRRYAISPAGGGETRFLITNENNDIIVIMDGEEFDFGVLEIGRVFRVWGLGFTGEFLGEAGANVEQDALSTECYRLSDDFIEVATRGVDGGGVSLAGGELSTRICANDGAPDPLAFENTSSGIANYVYVITDQNNQALALSEESVIDFEGMARGPARVWGLSYTGNLRVRPGDNILAVALSDDCYDLSENFVTVNSIVVDGGRVTRDDGAEAVVVCQGDRFDDLLFFVDESTSTEAYTFLLTDANNIILDIAANGVFDFSGAPEGVFRVWGLSYSGDLLAQAGQNAVEATLSDECFELSANFVTVSSKAVDGGTVSLIDGGLSGFTCAQDGDPDIFQFTFQSTAGAPYTFVLTDVDDRILIILSGSSINLDVVPPGECKLYGLSYTGTLSAQVGVNVNEAALSSECYDLSENFISIVKDKADGGIVQLAGGGQEIFTCPDDGVPDLVLLENSGETSGLYAYVLTDINNIIVGVFGQAVIDFEGAPPGEYRVWGLAYTGVLQGGPGDNVVTAVLSDRCYGLSANFVRVAHRAPDGGDITLDSGDTDIFLCPELPGGLPDTLRFAGSTEELFPYRYLITDTANIILAISEEGFFNLGGFPEGIYRIWGLAFTGALSAETGDDAGVAALSDDCYDLSANFISVFFESPRGGQVSLPTGDTLIFVCPDDGRPDSLAFRRENASGGLYAFLITDEDDTILGIAEDGVFDFEPLETGLARVWGLAYTGTLTARIGEELSQNPLTDECFALSENFITVVRQAPQAGLLGTADGRESYTFCVGDGNPDLVGFVVAGANSNPYVFLLADENGELLAFQSEADIDFDTTAGANVRVWGLSFTGNLTLRPGMNIFAEALADNCFELSANFIAVNRTGVDGGTIGSNLGAGTVFTCRGDGIPDILTFTNTSTASEAAYRYLITNENNLILRVLEGEEQDFENTGFARLRVWGVSFTGNLLIGAGNVLGVGPLSDDCFALSDNFILVVQDRPVGGTIATTQGEVTVDLCIGVRDPELVFAPLSPSQSGYRLLLTDTANVILRVVDGVSVDFDELDNGPYRVWGLSYAGLLLAAPGLQAGVEALASDCFELSANFVTVDKGGPVDGGRIFSPQGEVVETCPRNNVPDLVVLGTTSATADNGYRFVITDESNRIVIPDVDGFVIDFDAAEPGRYRIWGVSFTGAFSAVFGQDVLSGVLSTECYQVSENFIAVVHEGPRAGSIARAGADAAPFVTQACGGEVDDIVAFTNTGVPFGASAYVYLVVEEDTIVAVVDVDESFDFSTLPCDVGYGVLGLAYEGELPDMVGALIGEDLLGGGLLAECFQLSSNRLLVNVPPGLREAPRSPAETATARGIISISASPVPANDVLRVAYQVDQPLRERSELFIFDSQGRLLRRLELRTAPGENTAEIFVGDLQHGVYFLSLRNGYSSRQLRFIKS
jgi:hypothetical protein